MRDIAPKLSGWMREGRAFATARVISTWGSSPRKAGSTMAVTAELDMVGSVSGGCIEGEVAETARSVLESGEQKVLDFGVSNDAAWAVGLSCGGRVSIVVEQFPGFSAEDSHRQIGRLLLEELAASRPVVWVSSLDVRRPEHLLMDGRGQVLADTGIRDDRVVEASFEKYRNRSTSPVETSSGRYLAHVVPPRSVLLILGATDIATHLVRLAEGLDFTTVVIDPREVFAAASRFTPPPDRLESRWPQEVLPELDLNDETYAVLLTHDPKIDDPALHRLLASDAAYVGALGSSRTHEKRRARLRKAGLTAGQLDRIHGPVGLDIGSSSPAEIALSIIAQVVQVRNRRADR